jgi:hypothetical protein
MSNRESTQTSSGKNERASSPVPIDVDASVSPIHHIFENVNAIVDELSKDVEEEDEEDSISDDNEDSEPNDEESGSMMEDIDASQNVMQVYEEMVPVSFYLKSGDWEFRDQITWAAMFPSDILGNDCNDYVEYNLKDPRIDVFALRTVEDIDFPVGFDISIAKSLRAQLMTIIPILWKEKQSIAIQERKAANAQRRTIHTEPISSDSKFNSAPLSDLISKDSEEVAKLITSTTSFPLNAVRRLLKGPAVAEEKDTANREEEAQMDVDEEEVNNLKKRKRALEDEAAGRKKRKRGTAFEAHNLQDERIPIRLNLALCGVQLQDQFDWDPATPLFWSDIFARRLATELGLPREFELAIAHDIKRQVIGYFGFSSHQLPPDWNAPSQLSSSTSVMSTNSQSLKASGGGSINSNGPYLPTRSLPILNLHNVIRPPHISSVFAPSLTANPASLARWERLQSRKRPRSARAASSSSSPLASSSTTPTTTPTNPASRSNVSANASSSASSMVAQSKFPAVSIPSTPPRPIR